MTRLTSYLSLVPLLVKADHRSMRHAISVLRAYRLPHEKVMNNERFSILTELAREWKFQIYNQHLAWIDCDEFWNDWNQFDGLKSQRPDRKFVVWSMARSVRSLAGDTAECGVYTGCSTYLMCIASLPFERTHHVFDSFEGLSSPSDEDRPSSENAYVWRQGDLAVTEAEVKSKLKRFSFIEYHKGWIPGPFSDVSDRSFRFVHVDVDLYQPTRDSIRFFYDRLVPGGILLCDDYGYHTCAGARRAFDEFVHERSLDPVVHLPTGQGFIVKSVKSQG
jgi:O-methyltransferase